MQLHQVQVQQTEGQGLQALFWPSSGEQKLALRHGIFAWRQLGELSPWRDRGQDPFLYLRDFDRLQEARLCLKVPPDDHPPPFPPCRISSSLSHMQAGGGFQSVWEETWLSFFGLLHSRGWGGTMSTYERVQEGLCL